MRIKRLIFFIFIFIFIIFFVDIFYSLYKGYQNRFKPFTPSENEKIIKLENEYFSLVDSKKSNSLITFNYENDSNYIFRIVFDSKVSYSQDNYHLNELNGFLDFRNLHSYVSIYSTNGFHEFSYNYEIDKLKRIGLVIENSSELIEAQKGNDFFFLKLNVEEVLIMDSFLNKYIGLFQTRKTPVNILFIRNNDFSELILSSTSKITNYLEKSRY